MLPLCSSYALYILKKDPVIQRMMGPLDYVVFSSCSREMSNSSLTVTKRYPSATSSSTSTRTASTVWERSPYPSWNISTLPGFTTDRVCSRMCSTPGLSQSLASPLTAPIVRYPRSAARDNISSFTPKYGGRKQRAGCPVTS